MLKSLKSIENKIAVADNQIAILEDSKDFVSAFSDKLKDIGLFPLKGLAPEILQISLISKNFRNEPSG